MKKEESVLEALKRLGVQLEEEHNTAPGKTVPILEDSPAKNKDLSVVEALQIVGNAQSEFYREATEGLLKLGETARSVDQTDSAMYYFTAAIVIGAMSDGVRVGVETLDEYSS